MTVREAYNFFLRRLVAHAVGTVIVVLIVSGPIAIFTTPLTRSEFFAACTMSLCATLIGGFLFYRQLKPPRLVEMLFSRRTLAAGVAVITVVAVVLWHRQARAVPIDSLVPDCVAGATTCQVTAKGKLQGQLFAPYDAILLLFRAAKDDPWIIGDVVRPRASADGMTWTAELELGVSETTPEYEVLGVVSPGSARLGDAIDVAALGARVQPRTVTLIRTPTAEAASTPCCGGPSCSQRKTSCASGWERVPCEDELREAAGRWLLRLGPVRPVPQNSETFPPANEELEVCIRAGGLVQCENFPGFDGTYQTALSRAALEGSTFAVSMSARQFRTKQWKPLGRGEHHRVLVGPEAVCNGIRVPLKSDRFESVSIFLDVAPR